MALFDRLTSMADPSPPASVGLITLGVTLLGPMAGEYATIVLSALIGALWALGRTPTASRTTAAVLLLKLVSTAVVLTSWAAWELQTHYGWPAQTLLGPVAFFIAFFGDRWAGLLDRLFDRLQQRTGGRP